MPVAHSSLGGKNAGAPEPAARAAVLGGLPVRRFRRIGWHAEAIVATSVGGDVGGLKGRQRLA